MKIELNRINAAYHMQVTTEDNMTLDMDAGEAIGGEEKGLRPMQTFLSALAGCSTIDVIYLLEKQRQKVKDVKVSVEGKRRDTAPKIFTNIHLHYVLIGDIDEKKAARACRISMEKMCSVRVMLDPQIEVTWSFEVKKEME